MHKAEPHICARRAEENAVGGSFDYSTERWGALANILFYSVETKSLFYFPSVETFTILRVKRRILNKNEFLTHSISPSCAYG